MSRPLRQVVRFDVFRLGLIALSLIQENRGDHLQRACPVHDRGGPEEDERALECAARGLIMTEPSLRLGHRHQDASQICLSVNRLQFRGALLEQRKSQLGSILSEVDQGDIELPERMSL